MMIFGIMQKIYLTQKIFSGWLIGDGKSRYGYFEDAMNINKLIA